MARNFDQKMLSGLAREMGLYLGTIRTNLENFQANPNQRQPLEDVYRDIHTIQAASAMLGLPSLAHLASSLEEICVNILQHSEVLDATAAARLLQEIERLEQYVQALLSNAARHDDDAFPLLADGSPVPCPSAFPSVASKSECKATTVTPQEPAQTSACQDITTPVSLAFDLDPELVEGFVEEANGYLNRMDQELSAFAGNATNREHLQTVRRSVHTLKGVAGVIGFRTMSQLAHRMEDLLDALYAGEVALTEDTQHLLLAMYDALDSMGRDKGAVTFEAAAVGNGDSSPHRQERFTSAIQNQLIPLRMGSLATLVTRLHRIVRVTAQQQGKQAHLSVEGQEVQFDKTVLEDIAELLLHLLRNAVAHGIEPPALRQALGKTAAGAIHLRAFVDGTQIVIQVSDDGAGLDLQSLREAAVRHGFVHPDEVLQIPQEQFYTLIFAPGFSTTRTMTDVSGRGMGMDVVDATVRRLKGHISLETTPGAGVTVTIRLPLTPPSDTPSYGAREI